MKELKTLELDKKQKILKCSTAVPFLKNASARTLTEPLFKPYFGQGSSPAGSFFLMS